MCKRNRALLAVVFTIFPLIAVADSQVAFFGKLDADVESTHTSAAGTGAASARNRIATNASRFGARGSKDIGEEKLIVWQLATRVNPNGAETGGGGGLFTLWGNSRVGLQGNFGTLFLGVWDTPFRQAYDKVDLFDNSHIASPIGVLGSIGNGIGAGDPLYFAAAHERHRDLKVQAGANVAGSDNGTWLIGAYRIGAGKVGLVYERLGFEAPASGSTARNAYSLSGSYRFGDSNVGAVYTRAGDLSGTVATGADQFSLRYGHFIGEGAELYGQYTAIRNKANGTYNFGDGLNIATSPGARISGLGAGVAYAF
jgi:predicted porin